MSYKINIFKKINEIIQLKRIIRFRLIDLLGEIQAFLDD